MVTAMMRLRRRTFLVDCGRSTAKMFRRIIQENDQIADAVSFDDTSPRLDQCVEEYFNRVAAYKVRHAISPSKQINQSKRMALMVLVLRDLWPSDLFVFVDGGDMFRRYGALIFSRFICRTFMAGLLIDERKIPVTLERDVWHCFFNRHDVSEEWMANFARTYCICFGEPDEDDDKNAQRAIVGSRV